MAREIVKRVMAPRLSTAGSLAGRLAARLTARLHLPAEDLAAQLPLMRGILPRRIQAEAAVLARLAAREAACGGLDPIDLVRAQAAFAAVEAEMNAARPAIAPLRLVAMAAARRWPYFLFAAALLIGAWLIAGR